MICGAFVASAASLADLILGLGWGARWSDALALFLSGVFAAVILFASEAWYAFIGMDEEPKDAQSRRPDRPDPDA